MKCNCTYCNIEFEKKDAEVKRSKNNFCSRTCAAKHNNENRYKNIETKKCKYCDTKFRSSNEFCSKQCSERWMKKNYNNLPENTYKQLPDKFIKIKSNCEWCTKEFERTNYQIAQNRNRFCSEKCKEEYNTSIIPALDRNLAKTKADVKLGKGYTRNSYVVIRTVAQKIYKKHINKNECFNCGYDKHIQVAHIKAIKDFDESATVAEINSPDNLVGLCPNCHWEFDHGLLNINKGAK